MQEACKKFHLHNAFEATLPKGFHPHPVEVVEIEESPKSPAEVPMAEAATKDALETTPKATASKDDLSPESTEKVPDIRARRSVPFPKLWWDADGKIRVGRKLRFAPHLVKTTPQLKAGQELPGNGYYVGGGRYFSQAKMLWEPFGDESDSASGNGAAEIADVDMQEALKQALKDTDVPMEEAMEEERVLEDGYATMPMDTQAASLMFSKNL